MAIKETYYLHHTATNKTMSFGPSVTSRRWRRLVKVIHNPRGKMNRNAGIFTEEIIDIAEARSLWRVMVNNGFYRTNL